MGKGHILGIGTGYQLLNQSRRDETVGELLVLAVVPEAISLQAHLIPQDMQAATPGQGSPNLPGSRVEGHTGHQGGASARQSGVGLFVPVKEVAQ